MRFAICPASSSVFLLECWVASPGRFPAPSVLWNFPVDSRIGFRFDFALDFVIALVVTGYRRPPGRD